MLKHIDSVMQVQEQVVHLSCYEARQYLHRDDVLFVDVREHEQFNAGHIMGAVHCPRGLLEFMVAEGSPMQLEVFRGLPYKCYIVYCNGGRQSILAAKTLQDLGVPDVKNLIGGFHEWETATD